MDQIDTTLPPFFKPKFTDCRQYSETSSINQNIRDFIEDRIIEPYSENEDYLDKDDFSNLLNVLGQFAGKTGKGLQQFGEQIIDTFSMSFQKKDS